VEPLKLTIDFSHSPNGHNLSAYVLLKQIQFLFVKTNKAGCIVECS